MIKMYKKKPVVIAAVKFEYTTEGLEALKDFCGNKLISYGKDRSLTAVGWAHIGTLEDGGNHGAPLANHIATEGDYIIKGAFGEFYPCKPDIFLATYEEA
jgi:TPP-dependent trihydroxycyclohexane-1,2-dione (THcHDO) dehydratase